MQNNKIDRIIKIVRENMTVGAGGYTSSGDPEVKAGFDVIMTQPISRYAKGGKNSRKRWLDYLKKVKEK